MIKQRHCCRDLDSHVLLVFGPAVCRAAAVVMNGKFGAVVEDVASVNGSRMEEAVVCTSIFDKAPSCVDIVIDNLCSIGRR